MPPIKSMLKKVVVSDVGRAHDCQHSSKHRLKKGEKHLGIWKDRDFEYYCTSCALKSIETDIQKLNSLRQQLLGSE